MKAITEKITFLLCVFLAITSQHAYAEYKNFPNGGTLRDSCRDLAANFIELEDANKPENKLPDKALFCAGFIEGFHYGWDMGESKATQGAICRAHKKYHLQTQAEMVVKTINDNPELIQEPAVAAMTLIYMNLYPCE